MLVLTNTRQLCDLNYDGNKIIIEFVPSQITLPSVKNRHHDSLQIAFFFSFFNYLNCYNLRKSGFLFLLFKSRIVFPKLAIESPPCLLYYLTHGYGGWIHAITENITAK